MSFWDQLHASTNSLGFAGFEWREQQLHREGNSKHDNVAFNHNTAVSLRNVVVPLLFISLSRRCMHAPALLVMLHVELCHRLLSDAHVNVQQYGAES